MGFVSFINTLCLPTIPITVSLFSSGVENFSRLADLLAHVVMWEVNISLRNSWRYNSYTGRDLGSWLAEPIVVVPLSLLMILLACSMFGLFEVDLPNSMKTRLNNIEGISIHSILDGISYGICKSALCRSICWFNYSLVSQNPGSPIFGFSLMAAFNLGMGCLFLVVQFFRNHFYPKWFVDGKS